MEDPAARAREGMGLQVDETWSGGGGPPKRRRPRDAGWVLLFIALAAAAIVFVIQRENDAAAGDPRLAVQRGEVVGLSERSLARPVNLAPIVAEMDRLAGPRARLTTLRVAPTRVDATVVIPNGPSGVQRHLAARIGEDEVTTTPGGPTVGIPEGTLSGVDAADVRRALATVGRAGGPAPAALDHLVLSRTGLPDQRISVFYDDGARWTGTGNGSRMAASGGAPAAPSAPDTPALREALRIQECVQAAGGDVAAIQRCFE